MSAAQITAQLSAAVAQGISQLRAEADATEQSLRRSLDSAVEARDRNLSYLATTQSALRSLQLQLETLRLSRIADVARASQLADQLTHEAEIVATRLAAYQRLQQEHRALSDTVAGVRADNTSLAAAAEAARLELEGVRARLVLLDATAGERRVLALPAPVLRLLLAYGGLDEYRALRLVSRAVSGRVSAVAPLARRAPAAMMALENGHPHPHPSGMGGKAYTVTGASPQRPGMLAMNGDPHTTPATRRGVHPDANATGLVMSAASASTEDGHGSAAPAPAPPQRRNSGSGVSALFGFGRSSTVKDKDRDKAGDNRHATPLLRASPSLRPRVAEAGGSAAADANGSPLLLGGGSGPAPVALFAASASASAADGSASGATAGASSGSGSGRGLLERTTTPQLAQPAAIPGSGNPKGVGLDYRQASALLSRLKAAELAIQAERSGAADLSEKLTTAETVRDFLSKRLAEAEEKLAAEVAAREAAQGQAGIDHEVLRYLDERALELESAVAERTKERDALAERVKELEAGGGVRSGPSSAAAGATAPLAGPSPAPAAVSPRTEAPTSARAVKPATGTATATIATQTTEPYLPAGQATAARPSPRAGHMLSAAAATAAPAPAAAASTGGTGNPFAAVTASVGNPFAASPPAAAAAAGSAQQATELAARVAELEAALKAAQTEHEAAESTWKVQRKALAAEVKKLRLKSQMGSSISEAASNGASPGPGESND